MTHMRAEEQAASVRSARCRALARASRIDGHGRVARRALGPEVRRYRSIDVAACGLKGEVHFGWVLEGQVRTPGMAGHVSPDIERR
jgi:hypothetical protein